MKEITVADVRARQAAGEKLTILDVRNPDEREEASIEGTLFIPLPVLEDRFAELNEYKDQELIIHCRSGKRSASACMYLELQGFTNVVNLQGGIMAWMQ